MATESIRLFGAPAGVPGVQVREKIGAPPSAPLRYGTTAFIGGVLKRGPMGIPIPLESRSQYEQIFGKPGDQNWHLYDDALKKAFPDAIDGFYAESRNTGILWLLRNELDGTGTKAKQTFYARSNQDRPVLEIEAANEGRWGGYRKEELNVKVIFFEENSFIINAPNIGVDELKDGIVTFANADNSFSEEYVIRSNTKSMNDGTVECFLSNDIKISSIMETEGVETNLQLTGTINYQRHVNLTGTAAYNPLKDITGSIYVRRYDNTIYGNGTSFRTDLTAGMILVIGSVARRVLRVLSDTKVIVNHPYLIPTGNYTGSVENFSVIGTTSVYTTELKVGDTIRWYYSKTNEYLERKVRTIVSDTEIVLYDRLPEAFTADTLQFINKWVEGTGTDFTNQVKVGDVISGYEGTTTITVEEVDTVSVPERFLLSEPLAGDLQVSNVVVHPVAASIKINPPVNNGLSVKIGNGQLYPETHFSIEVFFEGTPVFRAPDVSLDRKDPFYVEESINNANIAYEDDGLKVYTWIKATSLLDGEYITKEGQDLRPSNAFASIVQINLEENELYYFTKGDEKYISGIVDLYFSPYQDPRRSIKTSVDVQKVEKTAGTFSTSGTTVTGVGTKFTSLFNIGSFLFDPKSGEIREIVTITNNTTMVLSEGFTENVVANTPVYILGVIKLSPLVLGSLSAGQDFLMNFFTDLEGGYDGDTETIPPNYITRYFDPSVNLLEKAALGRNNGLIRMAVPGVTNSLVQAEGLKYASGRAYEYRVEIPITYTDAIGAESYILREIGLNDFMSVSFPSYGTIRDPRDGRPRAITLSGDIMGLETFKASASAGYQNVAAGMNSRLSRIRNLPIYLDPFNDEALLNQSGIQPITRKNNLIVPFGARIPSATEAYRLMHVRRNQSQYIRMFVESVQLHAMLFRVDSPGWDQEVILFLRKFFEAEKAKGALAQDVSFGQAVIIERTAGENLGGQGRDGYVSVVNGEVYLNVSYRPASIVERIVLTVTPDRVLSSTSSR